MKATKVLILIGTLTLSCTPLLQTAQAENGVAIAVPGTTATGNAALEAMNEELQSNTPDLPRVKNLLAMIDEMIRPIDYQEYKSADNKEAIAKELRFRRINSNVRLRTALLVAYVQGLEKFGSQLKQAEFNRRMQSLALVSQFDWSYNNRRFAMVSYVGLMPKKSNALGLLKIMSETAGYYCLNVDGWNGGCTWEVAVNENGEEIYIVGGDFYFNSIPKMTGTKAELATQISDAIASEQRLLENLRDPHSEEFKTALEEDLKNTKVDITRIEESIDSRSKIIAEYEANLRMLQKGEMEGGESYYNNPDRLERYISNLHAVNRHLETRKIEAVETLQKLEKDRIPTESIAKQEAKINDLKVERAYLGDSGNYANGVSKSRSDHTKKLALEIIDRIQNSGDNAPELDLRTLQIEAIDRGFIQDGDIRKAVLAR